MAPLPTVGAGDGQAAWQGRVPCADCRGIDVRLVLDREGGQRRYLLVETYRSAEGGLRFVEHGQWRQDAALLRLSAEHGGQRTYALLPDGRLQSRDSRGRPLQMDDATLSPRVP